MFTDKTTATIVGVLFITATATAIIGGSLLLPVEDATTLAGLTANDLQMASGVLLELVLVMAVVGIAALLFPILKRHNEGLALSYLGARVFEGALLLAATVSALVFWALSQDVGPAGIVGGRGVAELLLATREWTYLAGSMIMFGVSTVILFTMLYQAKLVPDWLSLWGLAGGVLILVRGLMELYGLEFSLPVQAVFAAPIAINEMVLAVWLIVKGFTEPTVTADRHRAPAASGV